VTAKALAIQIEALPKEERLKIVDLVTKLSNGRIVDMGLALSASCPASKLAAQWDNLPHLAPDDAASMESDLTESRNRLTPARSRWE
jgi:hypothetical protein